MKNLFAVAFALVLVAAPVFAAENAEQAVPTSAASDTTDAPAAN